MKALPLCDGAAFLAKFKRLFAKADGTGEVRVLGVRAQGNVILLRLDGVTDMDAARAQVGRTYYFAKADARLPKGRYFIDDLLGCRVVDANTGRGIRHTDSGGPPRCPGYLYGDRWGRADPHAACGSGVCAKD